MTARRILVTGANGFVGRHLLDLIAAESPEADVSAWSGPSGAVVSRDPREGLAGARRPWWTTIDLRNRPAVRAALAVSCPDEVYHLAGAAHVAHSWRQPASTLEINVLATHILLDELRLLGISSRVLIPGSATIYAASQEALTEDSPIASSSPYALSKLAQERLGSYAARSDGQQVLLARAFNHVGPGQDPSFFAPAFAQQLAAIEQGVLSPVLKVGNLDARRDLTDVRDTVRAYRALIAGGGSGHPYNVCSGRAWRIAEVLDFLLARCRVDVRVEIDPARLRPNDSPLVLGSYARLNHDTGWAPRIPLEQTLADLLDDARARAARAAEG